MQNGIFLKRFFKKENPEEITWADFINFKKQNLEENQNLEYKAGKLLYLRKDYQKLAKMVAGFANAEGGLLVLGVTEHEQKDKKTKQVIRIRPGAVDGLPIIINKEIIENNLVNLIQYPIEGIIIHSVRKSIKSQKVVYLIDVPQSIRAPHRVAENQYYQRYNFSTLEMKHFQIIDLLGRRVAPDLDVQAVITKTANSEHNHFGFNFHIQNKGRAVAKYTTCLCKVVQGRYKMFQSQGWEIRQEKKIAQYSTGINLVIYPDIPTNTGYIEFEQESQDVQDSLFLQFDLMAENVPRKIINIEVPFSSLGIQIKTIEGPKVQTEQAP